MPLCIDNHNKFVFYFKLKLHFNITLYAIMNIIIVNKKIRIQ